MSEFSKITGCNINVQKSFVFHTNNEQPQNESHSTNNSFKTNKAFRNKFNQRSAGLFIENYKTLLKEIRELNKWKVFLCSWIGRLNIIK